jgi:hypothetical protein
MKNIHILPTDKPSRLHLWTDEKGTRLELCELEYSHTRNTQNIYITSNEEIKIDDWYLDDVNSVRQAITECESYWTHRKNYHKIILTTDQDLIKDGVQAIDDDFLEWFVNNSSCEEVEVKIEFIQTPDYLKDGFYYKIIIPKEEPKRKIDSCRYFNREIGCVKDICRCEQEDSKQGTVSEAIKQVITNQLEKEKEIVNLMM